MEKWRNQFLLIALVIVGFGAENVFAQTNAYIPLIGISAVPEPLALPDGAGDVTYYYAVKNFLREDPLTDIVVSDDKCSPIIFIEGDDNSDNKLDYGETWRYICTTRLSETTQSIATAIGTANNLPAAHKAYATVVVGSDDPYPLVNIINVSKISYPLTLPVEGGEVVFTYRVSNPGVVPLSNVKVADDKCSDISARIGDTNYNNLLDITEVWVYTCTAHLAQTTTNTVSITAFANGLKAVGYATMTVTVEGSASGLSGQSVPGLPKTGGGENIKNIVWSILLATLVALTTFLFFNKRMRISGGKKSKK